MAIYTVEMQNVVNSALDELEELHKRGKVANTPVSNTHFLVRWVTLSLKTQRFDRCVRDNLVRWQKMGRSKGTKSELMFTFKNISKFYGQLSPVDEEPKIISDSDIEAFLEVMEKANWGVSTEFEITGKMQVFTEGDNSFLLCAKQCDDCFEGGSELVKPMSFYVRGHHAEFVRMASEFGFMLHKRTDYKSAVKYHGEYLIYPKNQGSQLAEIPIGF
ncbi:DUF2913 family protein [Vibrio sp. VB16]|uniref:DUF2913 family protein n=1 Tax=Vibrio sp. VB16 TaxID=2785746 RepID=UPI00189E81D9|nr:DUF2913 family protein [Vibrio sp. VB16]UGA56184.1 DUF2913 family protein [Vibrio sp. VB16]